MGRTSDAREKLVASGCELMHERGYTAVGVGEICARAGVNKGSFYHFFPSKEDLALAILERYREMSREPLANLVSGEGAPLDRLRAFLDESYRQHRQCRRENGKILGCAIGNLALEMSTQNDALRERMGQIFDGQVESFATLLKQAVERGELAPLDEKRAARSIIAHLEGGLMLAKLGNDPELLRQIGEDVLKLVGVEMAR